MDALETGSRKIQRGAWKNCQPNVGQAHRKPTESQTSSKRNNNSTTERISRMLKETETTTQSNGGENGSQKEANKQLVDSPMVGRSLGEGHEPSPILISDILDHLTTEIHTTARDKGWWDKERSDGECIALMHSELSEALEALRHGNPPDDKIPQFSGAEAELADTIIRILDLAGARGWNVADALVAKMEFNKTRTHKHGGKKF